MTISVDIARSWYPEGDPVHGFDHVLRVLRLAERIAQIEGADMEIVRAAVLLHDVEHPLIENELPRNAHQHSSAAFAREALEADGWPKERIEAVLHCIRAHRFRDSSEVPLTLEAQVVFDADKLDAIGAIGVARAIAYAAQAGQPPYAEPSERFRQSGLREPGEPHSSYHEYVYKLSRIHERLYTTAARRIGAERHRFLEQFYQRLVLEMRGEA